MQLTHLGYSYVFYFTHLKWYSDKRSIASLDSQRAQDIKVTENLHEMKKLSENLTKRFHMTTT
jgi:hypothetical protein